MRSIVRSVILAVFASVVMTGGAAYAADRPVTRYLGQTALDPVVCQTMKAQLVAAVATPEGRAKVDAAGLRAIRSFDISNGSGCSFRAYETSAGSDVAEAGYVQGYWKYMYLNLLGWNAGTVHVDVGMYLTGYTATRSWGPNCYFQWATGLFDGGFTWCGVYNNGNWYTEPGANYWVNIYPFVGPPVNHYMRYCVYGNGASCSPWGS